MSTMDISLPDSFSYREYDAAENTKCYRIKEVSTEDEAKEWLKKLQEKTKVTWRVHKTWNGPECRTNLFKQYLKCQHTRNKDVRGERASKATGCQARLMILVQRQFKKSCAKGDRYVQGWPTKVTFFDSHNHPTDTDAILKHRDLNEFSKGLLLDLYRAGHSPASALESLKIDLQNLYGEEYPGISIDGSFIPTPSCCYKLYCKEFKAKFKRLGKNEIPSYLEGMVASYNASGKGKAAFGRLNDVSCYVSVCTSLMIKAHEELRESGEIVMLSTAVKPYQRSHRLHLLVTPTPAGPIPLGAVITSTQSSDLFNAGFRSLISSCFPGSAFNNRCFPSVFLTAGETNERNLLKEVFPFSRVLDCQLHLLREIWKWLNDSKNAICMTHRQDLYNLFKDSVYACSEQDIYDKFCRLLNHPISQHYLQWIEYCKVLWQTKDSWSLSSRTGWSMCSSSTRYHVDTTFTMLRKFQFERVSNFSVNQLFDFLTTRYEVCIERRLQEFASGKSMWNFVKICLLEPFQGTVNDVQAVDRSQTMYLVKSDECLYNVDIALETCDCSTEPNAKPCKHFSAVWQFIDCLSCSMSDSTVRDTMSRIASHKQIACEAAKPAAEEPQSNVDDGSHVPCYDEEDTITEYFSTDAVTDDAGSAQVIKQEFDELIRRMCDGLRDKPNKFLPAVRAMLANAKQNASTQSGLISAMTAFGTTSQSSHSNFKFES